MRQRKRRRRLSAVWVSAAVIATAIFICVYSFGGAHAPQEVYTLKESPALPFEAETAQSSTYDLYTPALYDLEDERCPAPGADYCVGYCWEGFCEFFDGYPEQEPYFEYLGL